MKSTAVIVTHDKDRAVFLNEALHSIYNQTRPVDIVLLLTDYRFENPEFLSKPNFRAIITPEFRAEMCVLYLKFNFAMRFLFTDAVFFICDDDMVAPTFVEKTLGRMEETDCDIVYTDWRLFGMDERFFESRDWTKEGVTVGGCLPITSLINKRVFGKLEYKDLAYGDWDFWWSAFELGFYASRVKEPLFLYRTHAGQGGRSCDVEKCTKEVRRRHALPA